VPKIKEKFSKRAGIEKFLRRWLPISVPRPKVARVEALAEMLRILHESEENPLEGIAIGDESWFQYSYLSSKPFARWLTNVIPRTRKAIGMNQTMITIFFTRRKLIMLEILPKKGNSPNTSMC
jgi:hypothetical protein